MKAEILRKKIKTFLDVEEYIKTKQKIYLNKVNSAIFSMKLKWNNNPVSIVIPQKNLSTMKKK